MKTYIKASDLLTNLCPVWADRVRNLVALYNSELLPITAFVDGVFAKKEVYDYVWRNIPELMDEFVFLHATHNLLGKEFVDFCFKNDCGHIKYLLIQDRLDVKDEDYLACLIVRSKYLLQSDMFVGGGLQYFLLHDFDVYKFLTSIHKHHNPNAEKTVYCVYDRSLCNRGDFVGFSEFPLPIKRDFILLESVPCKVVGWTFSGCIHLKFYENENTVLKCLSASGQKPQRAHYDIFTALQEAFRLSNLLCSRVFVVQEEEEVANNDE